MIDVFGFLMPDRPAIVVHPAQLGLFMADPSFSEDRDEGRGRAGWIQWLGSKVEVIVSRPV